MDPVWGGGVTIRSLAQSSKYLREFNFFTFADTLCFFPTLYQQICDEILINTRGFAGKKYKEREPGLICRKLCGLYSHQTAARLAATWIASLNYEEKKTFLIINYWTE